MKTQTEEFKQAKLLEMQRDDLRAMLQAKTRTGGFDKANNELLQRLDKLFFLHCTNNGIELSKFGRLK
jgi:hypothetical protein